MSRVTVQYSRNDDVLQIRPIKDESNLKTNITDDENKIIIPADVFERFLDKCGNPKEKGNKRMAGMVSVPSEELEEFLETV